MTFFDSFHKNLIYASKFPNDPFAFHLYTPYGGIWQMFIN